MQPSNPKQSFTQDCAFLALTKLIRNKPLSSISVTELTKKAGISRTAFYNNYNSVEDVIAKYFDKCVDSILDSSDCIRGQYIAIRQLVSEYFDFLSSNYDLLKRLDTTGNISVFTMWLKDCFHGKLSFLVKSLGFLSDYEISCCAGIEDCIRFCKMAKAIGVDVLNLSRGNMVSAANKFEVPPIDLPHGFNLPMASRVRRETGMITIGVGRINDPYFAEKVLEDDLVDMVAMSRAQLADPELMNKIRDGRINEIDRCCGCNEGCLDGFANLDMPHITCLRNPAVGREAECVITPSDNPRTVLVAGGGMAGMMAARTLRKRGHRVILCEASNRLGGQFILAGSTPHKLDMKKAALEMGEQIVNLGIDVRLNTPVTAELIRQLKSDAVFNCVGSSPIIPSIPGSSLPNVVESHDIIDGKVKVSGKVVIIGGGMVGLETAELLIESGLTPPTVLEMGSAVCVDMGSARKYCMMQTIEDSKIACVTDIKVTEIRENMVIGEKNGEHLEFPCDYAVFAVGSHSRDSHELKEACSELGIDLITVGDAKEARRALEATREAFDAALAF